MPANTAANRSHSLEQVPFGTAHDRCHGSSLVSISSNNNNNSVACAPVGQTRFVGKHAKDGRLAIFLQRRNINELLAAHAEDSGVDEILGLVRLSPDVLASLRSNPGTYGTARPHRPPFMLTIPHLEVRVGVMARLLCDYGLQFSEHFAYQHEVSLYQGDGGACAGSNVIGIVAEGGFLGEAILPDALHRGFRIRLPKSLPPSVIFVSSSQPQSGLLSATGPLVESAPWGLTWYVYAYVSQPSSKTDWSFPHDSATYITSNTTASTTAPSGRRKTSKVFLSFTRSLRADPQWLLDNCAKAPSAAKVSKTLLSTKSIALDAALERPFYYMHDQMAIHIRLNNPKAANISGLRVTLKQLITFKHGSEARQCIKVPLGCWEFTRVDSNGKFIGDGVGTTIGDLHLKEFPFLIDTIKIPLRPNGALINAAIESRLPRSGLRDLLLTPSFAQNYDESLGGYQYSAMRTFSISYYLNVHVVIPWTTNLIAKLPFHLAGRGASATDAAASMTTEVSPQHAVQVQTVEVHADENMQSPVESPELAMAISRLTAGLVQRDLEKAMVQLDVYRNSSVVQLNGMETETLQDFRTSRKSMVRGFVAAYERVWQHCEALKALRRDLAVVRDGRLLCDAGAIHDQLATALVEGDLVQGFIPEYKKLARLHYHGAEDWDRVDSLMEALNSFLDALELTFARLLDDANHGTDEVCAVIDQRLVEKELCRLGLVIPGMVEWRWLVEGIGAWAVLLGVAHTGFPLSDGLVGLREGGGALDASTRLAQTFQKLHDQLAADFSDFVVDSADIFAYGCDLAVILGSIGEDRERIGRCLWIQYEYWRIALLIYYGNYPQWLLPFSASLLWDERVVCAPILLAPPAAAANVRDLRVHLGLLRDTLVAVMADSL